jgi:PhoD-like phosphatase
MLSKGHSTRLRLGPIVGHTDHQSTRIWIRVQDDPSSYHLRVQGRGLFPFISTENVFEFGTALAIADGLRPDRRYRYQVLRRGRVIANAGGTCRTMPGPGSMAEIMFVAISCNHHGEEGAWQQLADFVEQNEPRFLLMMGDNVYVDKEPNVWKEQLNAGSAVRRKHLADQYQKNWSREPLRTILANIPTYMVWDDHDVRDGWGSFAPDSPTLAEKYPRGKPICEKYNAYFEDTRDVYWHFQMCHNPPHSEHILTPPATPDPYLVAAPPVPGERKAMPFLFQCGRTAIVVLDSRGDRDLWRTEHPVLGDTQWKFIEGAFGKLDVMFDALIVVTPVPIVGMDPNGQAQFLIGKRTDDVELLKRGDEEGLLALQETGDKDVGNLIKAGAGGYVESRFGIGTNWGSFKVSDIDDVRDQWSNHMSRPEQAAVIRASVEATRTNRLPIYPRGLLFIGGDWHSGGLFDIEISKPSIRTRCLISSGISQQNSSSDPHLGVIADEQFEVAPGIHATMREFVNGYNFGIIQVIPTGVTPEIISTVAHAGNSSAWGLRVSHSEPGLPTFP